MPMRRGCFGDFGFRLWTSFLRLYLDSRLRQSTCSHETHASSLVLLCYMRSITLTTMPCTITHSYAQKSLGTASGGAADVPGATGTHEASYMIISRGNHDARALRMACAEHHAGMRDHEGAWGCARRRFAADIPYSGHLPGLAASTW